MQNHVVPITMPGIHDRFYPYLKDVLRTYRNPKILEIGSGHGAFTQRLWNDGYDVTASDLYPENFFFDRLTCYKVDLREIMPFEAGSFDIVIAVEVMEHVHDHERFFMECNRILKTEGRLVFSTPNILSLKSRIRFLLSGFFYSFKAIDHQTDDGLQHLSSLTLNQYENLGVRNKLELDDVAIDKEQRTSRLFFLPGLLLIHLYCLIKSIDPAIHNTRKLLVGRILFLNFIKKM